jgi:hypothetical protein
LRVDFDLEGALTDPESASGGCEQSGPSTPDGLAASPIAGESVYVYFSESDVPEPSNQVIFVGGVGALPGNNPAVPVIVFQ